MTHTIEDVEAFTRRYYTQPDEMLPEASTFETAKNYRDKKAVPLLEKILEDIRSFKRAYSELWKENIKNKEKYERSLDRVNSLIREKEQLEEKSKTFDYVLKGLGAEKVRDIVERVKAAEKEKERERA